MSEALKVVLTDVAYEAERIALCLEGDPSVGAKITKLKAASELKTWVVGKARDAAASDSVSEAEKTFNMRARAYFDADGTKMAATAWEVAHHAYRVLREVEKERDGR